MDRPTLSLSLKKDIEPDELSSHIATLHYISLIETGFIADIPVILKSAVIADVSLMEQSIKSCIKKSNSNSNMKKIVTFN